MTQEEICRNYTARIFTSEYADGNGVIVGNRLITAAHVLENSTSFELSFGDYFFRLPTKSAKFFQLPEPREDGKFLDLAVFDLEDSFNSPISFFDGDIDEADFVCYAWRHTSDNNIESWKPFETDAMPFAEHGNFIECMMSEPLIPGFSGCPIFADGKLVGILHGSGDEGRSCFFLKINVVNKYLS